MNDDSPRPDHPNASKLRDQIDRGLSGDKVAAEDPSVAPLGTDDEAAGTPPSGSEVNQALQRERRDVGQEPAPGGTAEGGNAKGGPTTWIAIVAGALALLVILLALANWIG